MTWTDLLLLFGLLGLGVLGFELVLGAHDDATASRTGQNGGRDA